MIPDSILDSVASRWARLGVLLNVEAADHTPDLERLLLDTARVISANSRLLTLAASWLSRHASLIDLPRLSLQIQNHLEVKYRPNLGLLLELAGQFSPAVELSSAVDACGPAVDSRPLSDVESDNPVFRRLAEQRASALSRKWGRWTIDMAPKNSALRPSEWIAQHNPSLIRTASSDPSSHRS